MLYLQDIVILLDTSGSMTGLRKEIAKHVVINIMETLGEDDFVTVLTFSHETKPLVECFTDSDGEPELVQATNENIAEFTEAINDIETMEIANFTSALTAAFTLLERYRTKKVSLLESNSAHGWRVMRVMHQSTHIMTWCCIRSGEVT